MLKNKTDYIVTLLFLLISSKGSLFFYEDIFWFIFMLFILFKKAREIYLAPSFKYFIVFSGGYLTLSILQFVLNTPSFEYLNSNILFLFKFILLSYLTAAYLGNRFFFNIIRVVRHLAIFGLIMYFFQLINFDAVYSIGKFVTSLYSKANPDTLTKNFIFFNLSIYHNIRNSGFAWEPGAYGCFLVVTLYISMIRNRFQVKRDQILFLISILTTLSTTAYLGLVIVVISYLRAKNVKLLTMALYLLPVVIIALNLSFLSDKIQLQIFSDLDMIDNLSSRSDFYSNEGTKMPLNRFASMIFTVNQFDYKLIWGMGNKYEDYFANEFSLNLSNGDFDFIARFGVIGIFYYLYRIWSFFKYNATKELGLYMLLLLIILGYAENILLLPFFLSFIFLKDTFGRPNQSLKARILPAKMVSLPKS
ncbi:hypothetical protein ACVWYN_000058 [Pedobacter sp. UYP24]